MKKLFYLVLGIVFLACSNGYGSILTNVDDSLAVKIDALLQQYDKPDKPGFTIGIIDKGKIVFKKGYGLANMEKHIPNNADIVYKVASVSKQFTAAAILKLVQEKKLSSNDDIRKYIPEFPDYGFLISISDLLYHTSGIRDYMVLMWLSGISLEDRFSNEDAIQLIIKQKELNFVPKERCVYSNSNYILLAEIIKRITGLSLSEYAQNSLFIPWGMHKTGFGKPTNSRHAEMALGYGITENGYISYKNDNNTIGDSGLYTTLDDLLKWDAAFYESSSLNHRLLALGKLDNGNYLSYGMGIMTGQYRNEPIQMHPGAFLGYRAELLRFPEKGISIICLGNSDEINPETITRQIADIYVFHDAGIKNEEQIPRYDLKSVANVKGMYEVEPGVYVDVKYENQLLTGQPTGRPKQILYPLAVNTYDIGVTGNKVLFDVNSHGIIHQLTITQKQGKTIAQKLELVFKNFNDYVGQYHNSEQDANYSFFVEDNALWFRVGTNHKVKSEILKMYDRLYFGYKNLENATIDFTRNESGNVIGFSLSSGGIAGLKFIKK